MTYKVSVKFLLHIEDGDEVSLPLLRKQSGTPRAQSGMMTFLEYLTAGIVTPCEEDKVVIELEPVKTLPVKKNGNTAKANRNVGGA